MCSSDLEQHSRKDRPVAEHVPLRSPRSADVGECESGEYPPRDGDAIDGDAEASRRPAEENEVEPDEHDARASWRVRQDREDAGLATSWLVQVLDEREL